MALLAAIPDRNWVNIQWLARLRWAQIAGQAATVLVGQFLLEGALPMAQPLAVIAVGLVSNLLIELYYFGDRKRPRAAWRRVRERQIALVMMLDIAVLTGLLYFSGGPHNPFAFLYVVQIALATVLARALWRDRKSTRLNSSHVEISYAVFCLKKKIKNINFSS